MLRAKIYLRQWDDPGKATSSQVRAEKNSEGFVGTEVLCQTADLQGRAPVLKWASNIPY